MKALVKNAPKSVQQHLAKYAMIKKLILSMEHIADNVGLQIVLTRQDIVMNARFVPMFK